MHKNRIIVLIDLSEYSENLVEFAFSLSEILDAKVLFVHQISGAVPAMTEPETKEEIIRTEKLEALRAIRELTAGRIQDFESIIVNQQPVLTTLRELKSGIYTDWIFAGLKSTGMFKRIFIGSTTLSIIDDSDLLTVAVPVKAPVPIPKKLIVGVTPKFPLNIPQFDIILDSLKEQINELEFFSILSEDEDEEITQNHIESLRMKYARYHAVSFLAKGDNKFEVLKSHVAQQENPFLVLQQGSRSLDDKLFRKFMINELVYSAQIPLIVISK